MIQGIGASDGISIERIYKYNQVDICIEKKSITDVNEEVALFKQALKISEEELQLIKDRIEEDVDAETSAIFGAHIEILRDPELVTGVESLIRDDYVNADYALKSVSDTFVSIFENMDNDYFRERAADIQDVTRRVMLHIQGIEASSLADIEEDVIVVARDLTPSDTAQLDKNLVKGFITDIGGRTSHSAIMARTLEIPAVVGAKEAFETLNNGDIVILNGFTGQITIKPTVEEITMAKETQKTYRAQRTIWEQYRDKASITQDGKSIEIGANIGSPEDLDSVVDHGGDCIGLYRTEFLYMGKSDYPSEEEQYMAYKGVLEGMGEKPVVIRTLDIGGDKELSYMKMEAEANPFLGNRALRLCLNMPALFNTQLRALLRASVHGNLHIMFPMIATIGELRQAKIALEQAKSELIDEGISINEDIKIGMMIEIPAAAVLSDFLAKEVDFFSIGTNDLIQYTFAADRMNEKVSYLYQPFNPSLLRLIHMVIRHAHDAGIWVGMCGEMAGEIDALPILIGLGLDEFSMSASAMNKARYMAYQINYDEAKVLAEKTLSCDSQEQVLALVETYKREKKL